MAGGGGSGGVSTGFSPYYDPKKKDQVSTMPVPEAAPASRPYDSIFGSMGPFGSAGSPYANLAKAPVAAAPSAPAGPTPEEVAAEKERAAQADLNARAEAARQQAIGGQKPVQGNYMNPQQIADMRRQFFQSQRDIVNKELGAQRAEAAQGLRQQQQEASDALQRRFAALGQAGSGAQIAAMSKLNQQGLDAQRAMENQIGRGALDRLGAAEQEAEYQQAAQELAGGRQLQLAGMDEALKREIFGEERANKLKEYDLALKQFALDKDTTEFNKTLAQIEAKYGQDAAKRAAKGLFGYGGFLGTGFGQEGGLLGTGLFSDSGIF